MELKSFFQGSFTSKRLAFYLNLLGLTLAFAIFYVLMAEVKWVNGFDAFHKDAKQIYRVHNNISGNPDYTTPDFNVATIDELLKYSPDVEHGVLFTGIRGGKNAIAPADSTIGTEMIDAHFCYATDGLTNVFTFDMIEGNGESIADISNALIPLSLAKKLYGENRPYVGRTFGNNNWRLNVGGVYQDFPTNSIVRNLVYQSMSKHTYQRYIDHTVEWSYKCFVRLRKGADPKKVFHNFLRDQHAKENYVVNDEYYERYKILLYSLQDIYFLSKLEQGEGGSYYLTILYFILACLIVLIAAINFMNFSMATVPYRIKSINIKKVLGESRLSLRLSLLSEVFITVLLAMFLAWLLLTFLIKNGYLSDYLNCEIDFNKNSILFVYWAVLAFVVTLFSGLYPAHYITSQKPALVINGSFALSESGRVFRKCLIGIQFTISLIVIITILLMNSQNQYMYNSEVGYDRDMVFYMQTGNMLRNKNYHELNDKLKSCPNIDNFAWCESRLGESDTGMGWGGGYGEQKINIRVYPVQVDFLNTIGTKVVEGRDFSQEDIAKGGAVIFNETAQKRYNIKLNTRYVGFWGDAEVIGIIPDIKFSTFRSEVTPMAFYLWGSELSYPRDYSCAIRVNSPDKIPEVKMYIESVCEELTGGLEKPFFYTKNDIADKAYANEKKQIQMVLFGSIISLLISITGIFGLILFETQAKRKEIGVRKVFGSSTGNILLMLNKHYLKLLLICFIIAAPIAYYLYHIWLESFAYRTPMQWWLFAVAFLIVAIVVCATVTIQSWKAARELPVNVLHK